MPPKERAPGVRRVHTGSFQFHEFSRDTFVPTTWTRDRHRPNFCADLVDSDASAFVIRKSCDHICLLTGTSTYLGSRILSPLPAVSFSNSAQLLASIFCRDVKFPRAGPESLAWSTPQSWPFGNLVHCWHRRHFSLDTSVGIVGTFFDTADTSVGIVGTSVLALQSWLSPRPSTLSFNLRPIRGPQSE